MNHITTFFFACSCLIIHCELMKWGTTKCVYIYIYLNYAFKITNIYFLRIKTNNLKYNLRGLVL